MFDERLLSEMQLSEMHDAKSFAMRKLLWGIGYWLFVVGCGFLDHSPREPEFVRP